MIRIAMLSGWHVHAEGYAKTIQADPRCEVAAVWDEDTARGVAWADTLGCPFIPDLDMLLADKKIDGIVCNAPTNMHADILIRAAKAGKAIFTEKVLASNTKEANAVRDAVKAAGVPFVISFPHLCRPEIQAAGQLLRDGKLGDATYARVRNVHDGSIRDWLPAHFYDGTACCGGAMIDLGAHPMYTLRWLLGAPEMALSLFTEVTNRGVEDNAVTSMRFAKGTIGVAETGFVSAYNPYTLEISGTKGSLMIHGSRLTYANGDTEGKWVEMENLPEERTTPPLAFVDCVESGKPVEGMGIDDAVHLTEMMDLAYGR